MQEKEIMKQIASEHTWEQIIYNIVAWEGMDPWDLDIAALSSSFLQYISKLKQLDFKVPAKYVIISAVLLRMKSEHIGLLDRLDENGAVMETPELPNSNGHEKFEVNPIMMPFKRHARRKIMVSELVAALKKALTTQEKKESRLIRHRNDVRIKEDTIGVRIEGLYKRIMEILSKMKDEEIKFSAIVPKWERQQVLDTFLPLVFLDHDKKVECRQEEIFDEIFIRKKKAA